MVYIVSGFGLNADVETDPVYDKYIRLVVKKIFENKNQGDWVVFCGGSSDVVPPYKRVEAVEMAKLFRKLAGAKSEDVKIALEKKSLSSLENLVNSKAILDKFSPDSPAVIFCERTRSGRIGLLAERIFGDFSLAPVDLYNEKQLEEAKLMEEKEKVAMKYSLWALENPRNYRKFRGIFREKFEVLRRAAPEDQERALLEWWKTKVDEAKSLAAGGGGV